MNLYIDGENCPKAQFFPRATFATFVRLYFSIQDKFRDNNSSGRISMTYINKFRAVNKISSVLE